MSLNNTSQNETENQLGIRSNFSREAGSRANEVPLGEDGPENSPPVQRILNFSNSGSIEEKSYGEYLEKNNKKIEENVKELMNYDKEKLITKITQTIEGTSIEELQSKSFGDLWDMLINDRIRKYTESFSDKDYENIMINIFENLSHAYDSSIKNSNSNNYFYESQITIHPSAQVILDNLEDDNDIFFSDIDGILRTQENFLDLFLMLQNNNYDIYLLQSSREHFEKQYGILLDIININHEKITALLGEDVETTIDQAPIVLSNYYTILSHLFNYTPIGGSELSMDFQKFLTSEDEWFSSLLLLYLLRKIGETNPELKLPDPILTSKLFTEEVEISGKNIKCWEYLSKFIELITLPFFQERYGIDMLDRIKNLLTNETTAESFKDKLINISSEDNLWTLNEDGLYILKEIEEFNASFEIFHNMNVSQDRISLYTNIIKFYKIFLERSLEEDGGNYGGGGSVSSVNSEVYDYPIDININFNIQREGQPVITPDIKDLINPDYICSMLLSNKPDYVDNEKIADYVDASLKKFLKNIGENIKLHESLEFLKTIPNDKLEIIDIFRSIHYDRSQPEEYKITQFEFEENELVMFILKDKELNQEKLVVVRHLKSSGMIIPLVNKSFPSINYRDFPLNIELDPSIKEIINFLPNEKFETVISIDSSTPTQDAYVASPNPSYSSNSSFGSTSFNSNSNYGIEENSLSKITDTVSNLPNRTYTLNIFFHDEYQPKNYKFGNFNIESTFYLREDILNVRTQIKDLLIKLNQPITKEDIILDKVYLRTPNIEEIDDISNIKDKEYFLLTYSNKKTDIYYISVLQYNKTNKDLKKMYQMHYENKKSLEDNDIVLDYNSTDSDFIDTKIKVELGYYQVFNSENYKSNKLKKLFFIKQPTERAYNEDEQKSFYFNRRLFKIFKFNYTFNDSKSKADYFYIKQYLERLFNLSNLDDKTILDTFKEIIKDDDNILKKFTDIPTIEVEYAGFDRDHTQDTGIDAGGLRPTFFRDMSDELKNTFLSNLSKKKHEKNTETAISEYSKYSKGVIPDKYKKLQQCNYFNPEECKEAQLSSRKEDCFFNEDYNKCEPINDDLPLFVTKNDEKYNAFCRYNIPVEESYKLAGALLGKLLVTDNGIVLKQHQKVPRISVPRLNLSYYLANRLIGKNILDWVDYFACLKLDEPELYNILVGIKCASEPEEKKIYSIVNKFTHEDNNIIEALKYTPTSSYSCNQFKDLFGGDDEVLEDPEDSYSDYLPCERFKINDFFANVYLRIVEFYQSNCLEEYFYFSKGFNMIVNNNLLQRAIKMPLNVGILHKLFFGKNVSINELIDVEYNNLNETNLNVKSYYEEYIHNLFVIDESKITFNFSRDDKPVNVFDDRSDITLFRETNNEFLKNVNALDNTKLLGFYRLQKNLNKPLTVEQPLDESLNKLAKILGAIKEPILIIQEVKIPDEGVKRLSILKLENNNFIQVLKSNTEDQTKLNLNSILSSFFFIDRINNLIAEPILEYNNTKKHDNKIKKLLQFWTAQSVVPNRPKLNITVLEVEDRIPAAHTCFNTLDIASFKNYKTFEEKMNIALENFKAGEAFVEEEVLEGGSLNKKKQKKKFKNSKKKKAHGSKRKKSARRKKYYIKRK